jgi:hypothetical protein
MSHPHRIDSRYCVETAAACTTAFGDALPIVGRVGARAAVHILWARRCVSVEATARGYRMRLPLEATARGYRSRLPLEATA